MHKYSTQRVDNRKLVMILTREEIDQVRHQQAVRNLKKHLEDDRFGGAKIFCCEYENWVVVIGRPVVTVRPNGDHVIQVTNKRGAVRQWNDPNQIALLEEEFHLTRQLVLTAAAFEEVDPGRYYSAYSAEETDLDALTFWNEIRSGGRLVRHNGFDNGQRVGIIIWFSRTEMSAKFTIDPMDRNIHQLAITINPEDHRARTESPVPLQYVFAKEGLTIVAVPPNILDEDTAPLGDEHMVEAEEELQDAEYEQNDTEQFDMGANIEEIDPPAYSSVMDKVDALKDQMNAVVDGLNTVRLDIAAFKDLGSDQNNGNE